MPKQSPVSVPLGPTSGHHCCKKGKLITCGSMDDNGIQWHYRHTVHWNSGDDNFRLIGFLRCLLVVRDSAETTMEVFEEQTGGVTDLHGAKYVELWLSFLFSYLLLFSTYVAQNIDPKSTVLPSLVLKAESVPNCSWVFLNDLFLKSWLYRFYSCNCSIHSWKVRCLLGCEVNSSLIGWLILVNCDPENRATQDFVDVRLGICVFKGPWGLLRLRFHDIIEILCEISMATCDNYVHSRYATIPIRMNLEPI